jgi:hypothetical protein
MSARAEADQLARVGQIGFPLVILAFKLAKSTRIFLEPVCRQVERSSFGFLCQRTWFEVDSFNMKAFENWDSHKVQDKANAMAPPNTLSRALSGNGAMSQPRDANVVASSRSVADATTTQRPG